MARWMHAAAAASLVLICQAAGADEGMWPFHGFPFDKANSELKTRLDQAWLDRIRSATVRISSCTGSFVSGEGLILTNHHCVESCLAELSNKETSYSETGFNAKTRAEEKRCPTQVADVLTETENVTAKITAVTAGKDDTAANEARKAMLTQLEEECEAASKLECQAVTMYAGGQYWLYKYKRYTDVRVVFAPETAIAQFGGDPDNFQFPRYCLDMSLLRAYDNGVPVKPANYLRINFAGPSAGEAVFVAGHPGTTQRLLTLAQLKQLRNVELPQWLMRYSEIRGRYIQFAAGGEVNERIVSDQLTAVQNSIKVRRKMLDALHDDTLLARKAAEQEALRNSVAKNPKLRAGFGDPWKDIENALATERGLFQELVYLESGAGFQGRLAVYARHIVRGATEREKPNGVRFREYTDSVLPRVEQQLGAAVPVYPELEELRLSQSLERMREWLGPDHPVVRKLMSKDSPVELARRVVGGTRLARRVVAGTKLADPAARMELWKGGSAAVAASNDPMIELWRSVDAEARAVRKAYEDGVEAPIRNATERIAGARFASLGTSVYPDATFTLRLNYGTVQGWNENGKAIEPFTRIRRAFERATGAEPFRIPDSWQRAKDKLDLDTPFNLSTNNDIVGGNSGSPLINAKGELVGLMFDGNIHSISGSYWFDDQKNRAIAVHAAVMREALSKVYAADGILAELGK